VRGGFWQRRWLDDGGSGEVKVDDRLAVALGDRLSGHSEEYEVCLLSKSSQRGVLDRLLMCREEIQRLRM